MKKSKLILLPLLSLLLFGCGKNQTCLNHLDSNHDGKCDVCNTTVSVKHIDSDSDGKCDVCNAEVSIEESIDFTSFGWDENLARLFYQKLGIVIPYVPSNGYKYEYGVDLFGDNYVNVYLLYSTAEIAGNAFNQYYNTCSNMEYDMTIGQLPVNQESYYDGVGYADKVVEGSKAVEITFFDSVLKDKNGSTPALGLFATNYLYIPNDVYPQEAFNKVLGNKASFVPDLSKEDATYSIYFDYLQAEDESGNTYVEALFLETHIYSSSCYECEELLFNELASHRKNNIYVTNDEVEDYLVSTYPGPYYGQEFYCYCYSTSSLDFIIQFGITYTSSYDPYLYIVIYYNINF